MPESLPQASPAPVEASPPVAVVAPPVSAPPEIALPVEPVAEAPAQRQVVTERVRRTAPAAARPVAAVDRTPAAATAAPAPSPAAPPVIPDPAPVAAATPDAVPVTEQAAVTPVTNTQETSPSSALPWMLIAAGVAVLIGLFSFVLLGRRRRSQAAEYDYDHAVTAPAPAVTVTAPEDERPWIGLSINPLRAGIEGNRAVVEYELCVENAGDAPASSVRVSSVLVGGIGSKPIDSAAERTVDLASGASITITSRLTSAVRQNAGSDFLPMILAEARYPLPDGGEGHIAARFAIGIMDGDHVAPIALDGNRIREDVAAELDDVLERV